MRVPRPTKSMQSMSPEWLEAQSEELDFWGACTNTYGEETKQLVYMQKMGFITSPIWRSPYSFDGLGQSIIDVGGGPTSILLKFTNLSRAKVIDPCPYPDWVGLRYAAANIEFERLPGEELDETPKSFDIGLLYNVLQHTLDPQKIVKRLITACKQAHIFEWIDIPPHPGHPQMLRAEMLDEWVGRRGNVETLYGESGCQGRAWFI